MADIEIGTDTAIDDALDGTEQIVIKDFGTAKHTTPDQLSAYVIDDIEASTVLASVDGADFIVVLENGDTLKECDIDVVMQYGIDTMWGKAAETAPDDADVLLLKDGGTTEKTVTLTVLANDYLLDELEPSILDISDKDAKAVPVDADLIMVVDGTTPKKTTFAQFYDAVLDNLDTYTAALDAVTVTADADKFYVLQGATAKYVTLADIIAHAGGIINGSGAAGKIPLWTDADTLEEGLTLTTSFVAGSNTTVATDKAVRDEMNTIINDATAMAAAIVNADTILMDDGAAGTQRKATFTQVKTWLEGEYAYIAGMDQDVDTTATPEFNGFTITDAGNILTGAGTGTYIAASDDKLAFWGATPVVQQSHIADTAACAAMTVTNPAACSAMTQTSLTDNTGGSGSTLANITEGGGQTITAGDGAIIANAFYAVNVALEQIKVDTAAAKTAIDANNAQIDAVVVDVAALKTAIDNLNTTQDSINALCATLGLTAAS